MKYFSEIIGLLIQYVLRLSNFVESNFVRFRFVFTRKFSSFESFPFQVSTLGTQVISRQPGRQRKVKCQGLKLPRSPFVELQAFVKLDVETSKTGPFLKRQWC